MQRNIIGGVMALTLCLVAGQDAQSQVARTRSTESGGVPAQGAVQRDPNFPYVGLWTVRRSMQSSDSDELTFRFTVSDGHYTGITIHPDGGTAPHGKLTASSAGLTWEQPNSGGGTWVFRVRLTSPDSMVGTLVLRDAPANFPTPAPSGELVLTRQAVGARRER